ncbi:hypothetical protein E3Q22_01586 [Wallemia mellicola]|uniref:Uncharacterized protein n=1 Tax=Wallemia mellicola TaxID=1708541 RepID=A0A4T0LS30_9BASI|nr:hypothetical protein E3Q23_03304 [Wallemia mellicola]TIB73363.1 hypothetical protein E3Q24_01173 [Wallemia mellicola]TIB80903.1 hypothetical protein E3Q22_01586 [Wallemia mellicola]TIB87991.1 hypothetical protein E3Q21_01082 [Wallemia mellicola]TIB90819.1 hypothetical protein E3Q20_01069 [Wallemia mellicola]
MLSSLQDLAGRVSDVIKKHTSFFTRKKSSEECTRKLSRRRLQAQPPRLTVNIDERSLPEKVQAGLEQRCHSYSSCGLIGLSPHSSSSSLTLTNKLQEKSCDIANKGDSTSTTLTANTSIVKLVDFSGVDDDLHDFAMSQSPLTTFVMSFQDIVDLSQDFGGVEEDYEDDFDDDEKVPLSQRIKSLYGVDAS